MTEPSEIAARIARWRASYPDPIATGLRGMAEAGLLGIGLSEAAGFTVIARAKEKLVETTGLLGLAGMWAGRQMVARFFLGRFGSQAQIAEFMPRLADGGVSLCVAISEPGVGAHPKNLITRAVADGTDMVITGQKAWVSNALEASHIIVFAITAETEARKRYAAFLVPIGTSGLTIAPMPGFHTLVPSRHCAVSLDACRVPAAARLGPDGTAFEAMAVPFRDVEDAVGAAGMAGGFRLLLRRLGPRMPASAEAELGAIAGLTALLDHGARAVVAALDSGLLRDEAAASVGLRVLAADIRAHIGDLLAETPSPPDTVRERLLTDLDAILDIARLPRAVRQARLGATLRLSPG